MLLLMWSVWLGAAGPLVAQADVGPPCPGCPAGAVCANCPGECRDGKCPPGCVCCGACKEGCGKGAKGQNCPCDGSGNCPKGCCKAAGGGKGHGCAKGNGCGSGCAMKRAAATPPVVPAGARVAKR